MHHFLLESDTEHGCDGDRLEFVQTTEARGAEMPFVVLSIARFITYNVLFFAMLPIFV